MTNISLDKLVTESRNENTKNIDRVETLEMLKMINDEDKKVAEAVEKELIHIAKAVDKIGEAFFNGGRLIYVGAGTSGRLGVLDASECSPTYGVSYDLVRGIIAGGQSAMFKAKEGAEDSKNLCIKDLKNINFAENDILVGIAASGRTPYVIGGLEYANGIGATTISVTCNPESEMSKIANISIAPVVGPEAITGSTRMKAGTAQKMVLNMLSTGAMVKTGKVYGNLMVDLKATNEKLVERAKRIVMQATGAKRAQVEKILEETNFDVKLSIFMIESSLDKIKAKKILDKNKGYIVEAIREIS
ncbi:N-acetylmuramic acid 6-phosphate etherase [Clostridium sporogenes]|uniref:N-acetylmuramic acid 6-phosphate etherase n=2 Tax=Clostridium TaxID=1485 RepID=A0AAE4Z566_CLOSG|nr:MULTISPECIES: N-acetylmuramic acid 6-phosphate etherase [Clostridium]MBE6076479.1 N-acetylmuramic acid 6-phosphate etherase [Clostridium lundense]MDU2833357.1 N-acetylmuramic acid 6-phosphate etherase [Clostridium botulinum]EDU37441.1 N-acetylmuramic acid 6-phosphate etherase [Clostridium sporogenes ATCC 15579]KIS23353.1 N-acetylmuramic acid-6-phosphate etherase [Clostridium botulinum B2 450]MBU5298774.1 N-acetylmuramic acid 6-phosphate etherase [Clostridium sporogenes]